MEVELLATGGRMQLDAVLAIAEPLRVQLVSHPVYTRMTTPASLRIFMQHHVFAVWDFMLLLKALQRKLTCVDLPWCPTVDRHSRRLINEIVLAEESDADGEGGFASHFELYHDAMVEANADTSTIDAFVELIRNGETVPGAVERVDIPSSVRRFVLSTWHTVEFGSAAAIAAAFTLGRESLIPSMFRAVVANAQIESRGGFTRLSYYLDRHIGLDEDHHTPMALNMLKAVCGDDHKRWDEVLWATRAALTARLDLWDGLAASLRQVPSAVIGSTLTDLNGPG